jgi:Tol biopolymer transport system component
VTAYAQLTVTGIEKLPLDTARQWNSPRFTPDGATILFTSEDFNGIWKYSLADKSVSQVTQDQGSGYGFAVSQDGQYIAYRRTSINASTRRRSQEIVTTSLMDGRRSIVSRASSLPLPVFSGSTLITETSGPLLLKENNATSVLGIEDTKIAIMKGGKKVLLDPFENGSYIWPSLSPDGKHIVAYEMDHGAFVCDEQGNPLVRFGRRDAPVWTRDGRWIVYMNDKDDGHRMLSSDIYCVSPDGKQTIQLTDTKDILEMHPQCSPVDNKIVCSTWSGEIYVISYVEGGR